MSNTPSLLPCPFCGCKAVASINKDESLWSHDVVDWTRVHCTNDECNAQTEATCEGYEPSAIEVWNRRTPHPDVASGYADGWQDGMSEATRLLTEADGSDRSSPQPVVREPLTDEQLAEMMRDTWGCASIAPRHALEFARAVERAHGIAQKSDATPAELRLVLDYMEGRR